MSITAADVRHIAGLARLEIPVAEEEAQAGQLSRILELMRQLDAIPTDGVEPMTHAVEIAMPEREDRTTGSPPRERMLANAPDTPDPEEVGAGHFRVPKVIE